MFIPSSHDAQSTPSPRAQELGEQLAMFARDYRSENPDLTDADLDAALTQARTHLRPNLGGRRCRAGRSIYGALVVAMAMLGGAYVLTRFDVVTESDKLAPMLLIGLLSIGAVMVSSGRSGRCGWGRS